MWTVTFVSNRGTEVSPIQVNTGDTVTEPANVTKNNYRLLGWYTDANFTVAWDFNTDTVNSDITLYAKWRLTIAAKLKEILLGIKSDIEDRIPYSEKGEAGGVAELDNNGTVPIDQINDVFNEVLQFQTRASFPSTGEEGKLYIALDTQKLYRWKLSDNKYKVVSNQTYLQISPPSDMIEGDLWFEQKQ